MLRAYRTDANQEQQAPPGNPAATAPASEASEFAKWAIRLAAWGTLTVAVTVFLMRPSGGATATAGEAQGGGRTRLHLGSGVVALALETRSMLFPEVDKKPTTAPAPAPTTAPVVATAHDAKTKASTKSKKPVKGTIKWTGSAIVSAPQDVTRVNPAVITGDRNPFAREVRPADREAPSASTPAPAVPRASSEPVASAKHTPPQPTPQPQPQSQSQQAMPAAEIHLGSRYQDAATGYSMQFPAGWTHKAVKGGGGWVLDATDGRGGVISIGFAPFPANVSAEQVSPERIATALRARPGTVVHGGGFGNVGGRKCLWHKYTGPIPRTDGTPRMTAVHYLLPLQDGRALELRVAATPEKFNELAPRMKQSLDSFKLLAAPTADPRTAKAARGTKEAPKI